eukprot:1136491-Pelagomonas_calceolata.AAC.3
MPASISSLLLSCAFLPLPPLPCCKYVGKSTQQGNAQQVKKPTFKQSYAFMVFSAARLYGQDCHGNGSGECKCKAVCSQECYPVGKRFPRLIPLLVHETRQSRSSREGSIFRPHLTLPLTVSSE